MNQTAPVVNPSNCHTFVPKSDTNVSNCHRFVPLPEIAELRTTCELQPVAGGSGVTVPNAVSELVSTWRKQGLSDRQIRAKLKYTYPTAYTATYRHWRAKCSNAQSQGVPTDAAFRDFPAFLSHCGFKPGPGYEIHRIESNLGYSLSNVMWINPSENQHFRGDSAIVDRYQRIVGVSRRTAYRHLQKDRTAFLLRIGQTDSPPKAFDPTQKRQWEEANFLFRRFFEELELVNPNTIIPKKPSKKEVSQCLHLVQAFDYADLVNDIPAVIRHWNTVAQRAKQNYATLVGDEPSIHKFLQHCQIIIQLCREKVREDQERAHRAFVQRREAARRAGIARAEEADRAEREAARRAEMNAVREATGRRKERAQILQRAIAERTSVPVGFIESELHKFLGTVAFDGEDTPDEELIERGIVYFVPLYDEYLVSCKYLWAKYFPTSTPAPE